MKIKSAVRFCQDIGMFSIDRPRTTCKHATSFCAKHCYNVKLEAAFGHVIKPKDNRNEIYWQQLTGSGLNKELSKKRNQIKRVRLMTRGEAFSTIEDIKKVKDLLKSNPSTIFWIPTRAWRNIELRKAIESDIMTIKNARVQASLDPSNTQEEISSIIADGWSTMFFGDDSEQSQQNRKLCPKTHQGKKAHCSKCIGGCFSPKQTHVHLKQH